VATYRFQFNRSFGFSAARRLTPYLRELGISTLYASPILAARPGSPHGYDVVDLRRVNPELGGEKKFEQLAARLRRCGMGLLLDIVPNHMAARAENVWWWDVLKRGERSRFARFFDIDWRAQGGKVVLPVLGDELREVLAGGELRVERAGGELCLRYFDHRFPLAPGSARKLSGRRRLTPNQLEELLEGQAYRLTHWRTGMQQINYRRFFDISDLVGLRVEDPVVFAAVHERLLQLIREGQVSGLRVDHVDGLYDPHEYLRRLRRAAGGGATVVVEKILAADEGLRPEWRVEGTTGYDFLNALNRLFVDARGLRRLEGFWRRFAGSDKRLGEVTRAAKRQVVEQLFAGELESLAQELEGLAARDGRAGGLPRDTLRRALAEVTSALGVYRTYRRGRRIDAADKRRLETALRQAKLRPAERAFMRRVLLARREAACRAWVRRWQQFTGPAMAKGFEDTACYRETSLLSLNEVGSDAQRRVSLLGVEAFHGFNRERGRAWPQTLNTTSTHDTKRSEDVRARLNVLSELAAEWTQRVARWSRWNRGKKTAAGGRQVPDKAEESLLYQTLAGAWPLEEREVPRFGERVAGYLVKAAREAKVNSRWADPRAEHESALAAFVQAILKASASNKFLQDFLRFQPQVAYWGAVNSLAQVVLKAAAPGVPDFYQGTELWDFSLVDPDNRRPVDYPRRERLLKELGREKVSPRLAQRLWERWRDGRVKLYVTWRALRLRREHAQLFLQGDYVPLRAEGRWKRQVCAFARRHPWASSRRLCSGSSTGSPLRSDRRQWVVAAAPRLVSRLSGGGEALLGKVWGGTALRLPRGAPERWENVLTGERLTAKGCLRACELFAHLPVALLAGS